MVSAVGHTGEEPGAEKVAAIGVVDSEGFQRPELNLGTDVGNNDLPTER